MEVRHGIQLASLVHHCLYESAPKDVSVRFNSVNASNRVSGYKTYKIRTNNFSSQNFSSPKDPVLLWANALELTAGPNSVDV